jgi:hypothetical protein
VTGAGGSRATGGSSPVRGFRLLARRGPVRVAADQ